MLKTETNKKRLIEAMEAHTCIITEACRSAKLTRKTFYNYMEKDKKFRDQINELSDVAVDFAKSSLMKQIENGNTTATIFFLVNKSKGEFISINNPKPQSPGEIAAIPQTITYIDE